MCGISGTIQFGSNEINILKINSDMNRAIRHRGPDDEGYVSFYYNKATTYGSSDTPQEVWGANSFAYYPNFQINESLSHKAEIVLGHRRLSIVSIKPDGHQPMCDADKKYWIVFNGAIYNYAELKNTLEKLGHKFYSTTDTEVLLHCYIEWGINCTNYINGMWAFAIYDTVNQKLFASRDRLGVKPFYYTTQRDLFAFASEIKALKQIPQLDKAINQKAVYDYLILNKTELDEESFYKGIYELSPGFNLEFNYPDKKLSIYSYQTTPEYSQWEDFNEIKFEEYKEQLKELLNDSIKLHLDTKVPIGACLSGGLDSSIIVGLISQYKNTLPVFTVGSEGTKEDESHWAKLMVDKFNLKWNLINPTSTELLSNLEELIYCQDIPSKGANTYTHFELMRKVNAAGIKVTIDGQGADELFAGYTPHYTSFIFDALLNNSYSTVTRSLFNSGNDFANKKVLINTSAKYFISGILGKRISAEGFRLQHPEFKFINSDFWNSHYERISFLREKLNTNLSQTLRNDYYGNNLKTMLQASDRNSMHFGIESRVPFADDYRLAKLSMKIPAVYKIRNNYSKFILRESYKDIIPKEIINRKDKKGFSVPEKKWMDEMKEESLSYFNKSLSPYLNIDLLKKNWNASLESTDSSQKLWRMLCFAVWMKVNN